MPINSPDVFDSIGDAIVTGGGGGGGVIVTPQANGQLVFCTATTDELSSNNSMSFDTSTGVLTTSALETSSYIVLPNAGSAGNFGSGAKVFKGLSSGQSMSPGACYAIQGTTITKSNATSSSNVSIGFLGIATSNASSNGILLEGCVVVGNTVGGSDGDPVYLDTIAGQITTATVGTLGNVSRVVGYKISSNQIYFKPSQDWIVIS